MMRLVLAVLLATVVVTSAMAMATPPGKGQTTGVTRPGTAVSDALRSDMRVRNASPLSALQESGATGGSGQAG
jgi:hypothetical protein